MKKRAFSLASIVVLMVLTLSVLVAEAENKNQQVDVMFLHDTHSHLNEFATVEDGKSQVLGGFAKIKTLIDKQKAKNPDTLLLFHRASHRANTEPRYHGRDYAANRQSPSAFPLLQ